MPNDKSNFTESHLAKHLQEYENFFPIAAVNLDSLGIKQQIHIFYTFFETSVQKKSYFKDGEDISNFSFIILEDGSYDVSFDKEALKIVEWKKYLEEFKSNYQKFLANPFELLDIMLDRPEEPEWWQSDETPLDDHGEPLIFVCQVDCSEIIGDDCRIFVFYDEKKKIIKNIYQRT